MRSFFVILTLMTFKVSTHRLRVDSGYRSALIDMSALPTCPGKPSTTPEQDLAAMAARGMTKWYGNASDTTHLGSTSEGADRTVEFTAHGGDILAHTYGEVTLEGMQQILHEALRLSLGADTDVFQHASDFVFYDLGSGFGKFPMFASFMGFNQSIGIELDSQRAKFAADRWNVVNEELPNCADTLKYIEGSFLTNSEWARGTEKRVIFMDAVCWRSIWPQVTATAEAAEWGNETVIASLGQTTLGNFNARSRIFVKTAWSDSISEVVFFTKCQSEDAADCSQGLALPTFWELFTTELWTTWTTLFAPYVRSLW